jgi:predicted transcriptional regulator
MELDIQRCRVYAADGHLQTTRTHQVPRRTLPRTRTIADAIPVTEIMAQDLVCARQDLSVDKLTELLVRNHIGCIPVVDDRGHPIGIVTKLDIVERTPKMTTAGELMMPLAITLNQHATIAHAAAVMAVEDFHHVMVVATDHTLMGVVSTMDIARWLARNDGFMSDG